MKLTTRSAKGVQTNAKGVQTAKGTGGKKSKAKAARRGGARGGNPYSGQSSGSSNSDLPF